MAAQHTDRIGILNHVRVKTGKERGIEEQRGREEKGAKERISETLGCFESR